LKVLHVIASVDPRSGGPIAGVLASAEVWERHGHTRRIVSLDPTDAEFVAECPIPVVTLGFSGRCYKIARKLIPWLRYGYSPRLAPWLEAHAQDYDAVIVNGLWNYASFGAWRGLRGGRTPYFLFTHGALDPWFNTTYPVKTFFKKIFWKLFEWRVPRDAHGVLFTSEEERIVSRRSFVPYVAKEIVVGYGSHDVGGDPDAQRAAFYAHCPTANGRRLVLFLSRIHEKKGVDLLIDAFARLADEFPDFDLVIAGPDQVGLQASLQRRAQGLGIAERIHWPGMLSGDVKWGAYRAAEFFVLPSHQENFGIVVTDAMALSLPVLITDKVNIWREVDADGAGVVVDDKTGAIADGLRALFSMTATERASMGEKARESFLHRYDIERNALELLRLMESCLYQAQADDHLVRSRPISTKSTVL
jgi:glycosyltransferase involved in cell wall biosynthesis